MLTVKQPAHYGFKSVHDLPTPPSTSRPSPPLTYQDEAVKRSHAIPRTTSPSGQPMSGPHRGLPPPAAMTLAQPPPPHGAGPPPPAGPQMGQQVPAPPPHPVHQQSSSSLGQLPAPPQWQQGPDESMRAWLHAKAEEEKRRQEEEKTRQESLRLEQRRTEHEILRTSLQGGIPPPMVPVVFAGMGGNMLPQAALEWAHQFMHSQVQQSHQQHAHQPPQLPPASGHISPEHRRDSQSQPYGSGYQPLGGIPPTPGSIQGPHGSFSSHAPGSPARPRGYSIPGTRAQPHGASNLPALNTNVPPPGGGGGPGGAQQPPHAGAAAAHQQSEQAQSSPSIYFHHWHPPASQAASGGSNQPATPSEKPASVGESPQRKRKATGPIPGPPPSTQQRLRSPPFVHSSTSAAGRRRGHSRQRSDLSLYRPSGRGNGGGSGRHDQAGGHGYGGMSPAYSSAPSSAREGDMSGESSRQQQQQPQQHHPPPPPQAPQARSGPHSVSSLLSEEPSPRTIQYHSTAPEPDRKDDSPGGATRSGGSMRPRNNE
ncbi:hypothetical protein MAPG_04364 [Magnaporthiopsis poae ATCC 64411]|uniref:Uncharacterized protein n=1 Tax=Magnaporthiopsis poae (strain ATCC 64411 / 73-15) TaxID=644358 RepID=A0A0C4DWI3_MAGP6|nr:hypothetical protein MAPG_04364 [Magnaporthiopsis poae ATCC 64411]